MSNLREIKAAMPADFVLKFKEAADSYGMTSRQLVAVCISFGYKVLHSKVENACSSSVFESSVHLAAEGVGKASLEK